MADLPLCDHIAIVTGAARGFGQEFAHRLLKSGAKVCISDVNEQEGNDTLKAFKEEFGPENVTFCKCDVSKPEDWTSTWNHAESKFQSQVTLLVNNAGLFSTWQISLDIMIYGVCHGSFLAIDRMSTSKGGKGGLIINIASMAGFIEGMRTIEEAGYAMSKSAVVSFTRSFAQKGSKGPWKRDGIKAFALCPWFARTQLVMDAHDGDLSQLEKRMGYRVLSVSEVGDAFMQALKLRKTGACYTVFPDCPLFDYPNPNFGLLFSLIFFGRIICRPLKMSTFDWSTFLSFACILLGTMIFSVTWLLSE